MPTMLMASNLKQLGEVVRMREEMRKNSEITEEKYLEIKAPTPRAKPDRDPIPPNKNNFTKIIQITKIVAATDIVLLISGIMLKLLNKVLDFDFIWKAGNYAISFFIILLIACGVLAKKALDLHIELKPLIEKYERQKKEAEENKKYNETVLPGLLAEREAKLPALREEYAEWYKKVLSALENIEKLYAEVAHFLPEYYHKNAGQIATILEHGRADSIKEAINIFEEDCRAEMLAEENRRHQEKMEKEASATARAAEEARKEAQRKSDAELNARKDAASKRCRHCANAPSCAWNVKDGFMRSGDVCPSYRPSK